MKKKITKLFDELFKFEINQDVRHRGDTKGHSADMGLLVLSRHLAESEAEDGEYVYEKIYHCRMIRFSGSGEIGRFMERELMTVEEYDKKHLEKEDERNKMRLDMRQQQVEIYALFNVVQDKEYTLDIDGNHYGDRWKVTGWKRGGEKGICVTFRPMIETIDSGEVARVDVYDPKEIKEVSSE